MFVKFMSNRNYNYWKMKESNEEVTCPETTHTMLKFELKLPWDVVSAMYIEF